MWYSTGTVSVTANSATVTGTGTAFSANARVGDAFRGPDGRWYEITNIASATVLSIRPNYQGATASGQAYAIAPMQGYVKESADRLRQLVDQYGSQLAALQPWAYAATAGEARNALGATAIGNAMFTAANQAAGRTALGLGSAATKAAQSSPTDTTYGALMAVGAFGLGDYSPVSATLAELDTASGNRYLRLNGYTGGPFGETGSSGIQVGESNDWRWQLLAANGESPQLKFRVTQAAATFGEFVSLFHTGNILGTVSQTAGVPTGAIIERGSNANGEYVRFADGTQICSRSVEAPGDGPRETYFEYAWPAAFANTKYTVELNPDLFGFLVTNIKPSAKPGQGISRTLSTNSSSITVETGGSFTVNVTAIGRWY